VVEATVPSGVLSLERFAAGQELRVSFCRYDAGTTSAPVLSTCANHPVVSFHRPAEWPRVVLAD
jgi:hypothetical protein